nr:hypothetical protein Iba_chr10dCG10340 [Ipomoea batatas]GMD48378.1 hypothetical protein Iba_chr10fCG5800 [Ipomoea batatas]
MKEVKEVGPNLVGLKGKVEWRLKKEGGWIWKEECRLRKEGIWKEEWRLRKEWGWIRKEERRAWKEGCKAEDPPVQSREGGVKPPLMRQRGRWQARSPPKAEADASRTPCALVAWRA